MATNGDLIVKINSAEILKLEKDGENIIFDPKAEDAISKLIDMKHDLDGAIDYLKSEIERQALEFNPNFTGLKGEKIKINYSASGAKFKDTGEITYHRNKFWSKKTVWSLDSKAIEEYKAKNRKLPKGIAEIHRRKSIRISEVQND